MGVLERASWIWDIANTENEDEYVEFFRRVRLKANRKTLIRISCDGDYTLFVNGRYVASNQYGDFAHYKIYDELDITDYVIDGENAVACLVWHFGWNSSRYIVEKAGLIYEIEQDGDVCAVSDVETLCRKSLAYKNGYKKIITNQLGYSFLYNAAKEDDWINGDGKGFMPSVVQDKAASFFIRPNQKLTIGERTDFTYIKKEKNHFLIDLGEECVGCPVLEFRSDCVQKIRVDFGEHILDGGVRRIIGARDFSFEYIAKKGENRYINYMLRLGCRYLEVYSEYPLQVQYIGLLPQTYPVRERPTEIDDVRDRKIYDMCVNTLRLCMMEHYVDCPWREQSLYAFDSRNQMLCGYYAFEDGNAEYARSNLKLMSEDRRADGLLSICYPCGVDLTIPSFSLHYFLAVREYVEYTGDIGFAQEIYEKLISVLQPFVDNMQNGLVCKFEGNNHWNFYDWSPYLSGNLHGEESKEADLIINVLFVFALQNLKKIDELSGKEFLFADVMEKVAYRTRNVFFRKEKGLFALSEGGEEYTVLGNALAILTGIVDAKEAVHICEKIENGELSEPSLSMKVFKYDALLSVDKEKYKDVVLSEIRADYQVMINAGTDAVWETVEGAAAFGNAGSLCHGWSAIPVYYFHKLQIAE